MAGRGKRDNDIDNRLDRSDGGDSEGSITADGLGSTSEASRERVASTDEAGLTERLTDVLVDRGDGDLLLQQSIREDRVLQWLQALNMQVIGACRADERLTPLLKLNAPGSPTEDRLLAHLSQHFEPSEVGMLARCFCMPLVSVRVGKILKQGRILCPTSVRGNLNLTLLPTSDLRLSFVGDEGQMERIVTLRNIAESNSLRIEEISEDASGRSFLVKIPDGREYFFWSSEKSRLLGVELLRKMRELVSKRPTVAELTGINESRLDCFASYLRAYLVGAAVSNSRSSNSVARENSHSSSSSESTSSRLLQAEHQQHASSSSNQVSLKSSNSYHLSPRVSSFKEGFPRSLRNAREKLKKRIDIPHNHHHHHHHLTAAAADNLPSPASSFVMETLNFDFQGKQPQEATSCCPLIPGVLESLGKLTLSPSFSPISPGVPFSTTQPIFSPYYCGCPPVIPELTAFPSNPFPPSSSSSSSTLLIQTTSSIPSILPDPHPLMRPSTSLTPLGCDPIVHIPVINVCSAGQGYLVSAGPTNSIPLIIPEPPDSVVAGARETLQLLLSGSTSFPANAAAAAAAAAMLTSSSPGERQIIGESRGLYNSSSSSSSSSQEAPSGAAFGLMMSISISRRDGGSRGSGSGSRGEPSSFEDVVLDDDTDGLV